MAFPYTQGEVVTGSHCTGIIKLVDAGFAASGSTRTGMWVTEKQLKRLFDQNSAGVEAWGKDEQSCLIFSDGSASGVVDQQRELMSALCSGCGRLASEKPALVVRADANTNLITQRTLIRAI